jgi:hypothetical protein
MEKMKSEMDRPVMDAASVGISLDDVEDSD